MDPRATRPDVDAPRSPTSAAQSGDPWKTITRDGSGGCDPRTSLALWLRAGRADRKLSLDDVARVTKIQPRILEQLETGQLEGLPAEVFVRGFVKSFARCVGLSEGEALKRYVACADAQLQSSATARAFIETLVAAPGRTRTAAGTIPPPFGGSSIQPPTAMASEQAAALAVTAPPEQAAANHAEAEAGSSSRAKHSRKKTRGRRRKKLAHPMNTSSDAAAVEPCAALQPCDSVVEAQSDGPVEAAAAIEVQPDPALLSTVPRKLVTARASEPSPVAELDAPAPIAGVVAAGDAGPSGIATPEAFASAAVPAPISAPWRRPSHLHLGAAAVPSLVIDDANPDLAEQQRDEREAAKKVGSNRVSFLPPILLDRDERGGRQGGLTLAVILLLIAATLTLSYLMRQPSVSGDGVTVNSVDSRTVAALTR